ncbi:hypothetical protein Pla100_61670 [Neorhodopirellula pilleata]|uniref:Uncharacterized protein n=1 Tax=Neorhodopirellula pilleata TaxID=2714738 RepID=A0A5C5ZFM0_9BACT|nr:hypothetical protein Pla100_61670 [Neorhodopirellula pilleata]
MNRYYMTQSALTLLPLRNPHFGCRLLVMKVNGTLGLVNGLVLGTLKIGTTEQLK